MSFFFKAFGMIFVLNFSLYDELEKQTKIDAKLTKV